MATSQAIDWVDQIADYDGGRVKEVSLTGGEPFFDLDALEAIAGHAKKRELRATAVTNAFWADAEGRALEILERLGSIDSLAVSCDAYHQRSIPFERVRFAIGAARKLGRTYYVVVCTHDREAAEYLEILNRLHEITEPEFIETSVVFEGGRARDRVLIGERRWSDTPPRASCFGAASPVLFPNGDVIACIGPVIDLSTPHPLRLGNLDCESLAEILDRAETDVVLHALRVWGPRKLISELQKAGFGDLLPTLFEPGNVCSACCHLMANPEIGEALELIAQDKTFRHEVAYGRAYYLEEYRMAELMGLTEEDCS